jgi:ribosomal protein L37AE/L43A
MDTKAATTNEEMDLPQSQYACPHCKSKVVRRARRKGILRRYILPYLGLYPWICRECKGYFLLRARRDDTFGYVDSPKK